MPAATPGSAGSIAPWAPARGPDRPAPLELTGIVKSWRGLPVLRAVDLSLEPGRVTWLGGHNGAGKTTLLRIAAALIVPEAGVVRVHGLDPRRQRRAYQSRVGYLPAGNGGLYARLTVERNLHFWGGMALLSRRERGGPIDRVIERFRLEELRDRRVDRLSMGQRQRVRLAATFLHDPDVVLLDEPQASLDDDGMELVDSALDALCSSGGAALWCSPSRHASGLRHDVSYLLDDGRVRSP